MPRMREIFKDNKGDKRKWEDVPEEEKPEKDGGYRDKGALLREKSAEHDDEKKRRGAECRDYPGPFHSYGVAKRHRLLKLLP